MYIPYAATVRHQCVGCRGLKLTLYLEVEGHGVSTASQQIMRVKQGGALLLHACWHPAPQHIMLKGAIASQWLTRRSKEHFTHSLLQMAPLPYKLNTRGDIGSKSVMTGASQERTRGIWKGVASYFWHGSRQWPLGLWQQSSNRVRVHPPLTHSRVQGYQHGLKASALGFLVVQASSLGSQ